MAATLTDPTRLYRALRGQLGSVRRVYMRDNRVVRRDDFWKAEEPVLLLHGFMQTRNVWDAMEDRLRHDGYGVFSFDLGGLLWRFNTRAIGELAATVAEKIEGLRARTGLGRFHIIGHSKGGLIARHYIQHHGGDRQVKSLITLGTPHHGTPTAAIGVGLMAGGLLSRSPLEMLPGSAFLRRLAQDTFPSAVPLTSIYSRHDLVCPWWCSVLRPRPGESSMRSVAVSGLGHTALCHDPAVYHLVRVELERAAALWAERAVATESERPGPERG